MQKSSSGLTWCVLGLSIEAFICRDFSWSLTPAFVPVPALNAGNSEADLERRFGPSNLGQSMDYYILLESPGCLLSNAIESAPIGLL